MKLTDEKILEIAANNGTCSEHGDEYGYVVMYKKNALDFARAIEALVLQEGTPYEAD